MIKIEEISVSEMMKTEENSNEEKSIKTTITQGFSNAIQAIAKRSNRNESDIFRNAIEFYLKTNYPEFLPKTAIEILNQVKQKYQFEKTLEQYRKDRSLIENIPVWQNILKVTRSTIAEYEKKIDDIEGKLRVIVVGKKEEKQSLETELKEFQQKLDNLKQREAHYKQTLENPMGPSF